MQSISKVDDFLEIISPELLNDKSPSFALYKIAGACPERKRCLYLLRKRQFHRVFFEPSFQGILNERQ